MIVIGGSAGSFEPLREILSRQPADLPAAILVIHISERTSGLGPMLSSFGKLPAYDAKDGETIRPGRGRSASSLTRRRPRCCDGSFLSIHQPMTAAEV